MILESTQAKTTVYVDIFSILSFTSLLLRRTVDLNNLMQESIILILIHRRKSLRSIV